MWFKSLTRATRTLLQVVSIGLIGCLVAVVIVFVYVLDSRPDLSVWHLADLDEEFTAKSDVSDFSQYLALEDRLFEQLDALVYAKVPQGPENTINRYSSGSLSDPGRWPVNWNRTFELRQKQPRAGVLLLHGLSDSPYSMRALAQLLHDQGASVVGLRIPGHGTAPSGLVETRWQDMAAAVRLAAKHVLDAVGDKPFYLVGYSNGGALSVEYTLSTLNDTSLPRPSGVILLSPEIGVSAVAALAVWQGRLGHLLGLEKLAWNGLLPEYDPYKYGSFAVNAGDLAHRITVHIQEQLDALQGSGKLEKMPPILAFQSSVDATVTASALVANLFARLPPANHELVLFDINRNVKAAITGEARSQEGFQATVGQIRSRLRFDRGNERRSGNQPRRRQDDGTRQGRLFGGGKTRRVASRYLLPRPCGVALFPPGSCLWGTFGREKPRDSAR